MDWLFENLYIVLFATSIVSAIVGYLFIKKHVVKTWTYYLSVTTALVTMLIGYQSNRSAKKSQRKADSVTHANDSLQRVISLKADKIDSLQTINFSKLQTKSEKLINDLATVADKQKNTLANINGTPNPPHIKISTGFSWNGKVNFTVYLHNLESQPIRGLVFVNGTSYEKNNGLVYTKDNGVQINQSMDDLNFNRQENIDDLQPKIARQVIDDHFPYGADFVRYVFEVLNQHWHYKVVVDLKRDGKNYEVDRLKLYKGDGLNAVEVKNSGLVKIQNVGSKTNKDKWTSID